MIFLLHNSVAPYRLPIFEKLSKELNLHVFFCYQKKEARLWDTSLKDYTFKYTLLKKIKLKIGKKLLVINPFLIWFLCLKRYDVYVVGYDPSVVASILKTFIMAKIFRRPFILWSASLEADYLKPKILLSSLFKKSVALARQIFYRYCDAFIAYGVKAREYLITYGVDSKKIFMGTQVISRRQLQKIKISKKDLGLDNKFVVLTVSYLEKRKGIDYLIEAFRRFKQDDIVLLIIGEGEEKRSLELLANNNPRIKFLGYKEGIEKFKYFSVADIFVLPTLYDPWGLVVNEAMAFGLPVVTTNDAGASELIKDNGFVVRSGNIEAMKKTFEVLYKDKKLRKKMGRKSEKYIKKFNLNYAVDAFKEAIVYASKTYNARDSKWEKIK